SPAAWLPTVLRIPLGDLTEIEVDLVEGELTVRQLDLVVAGGERPLRLVREHRGLRRSDGEGFGHGWTFTAGRGVRQEHSDRAVRLVDARGRAAVLHRDGDGRIVRLTDPLGQDIASYHYDSAGSLVRLRHRAGPVTDFVRDAEDRLVRLTADEETLRFSYDGGYAVGEIDWSGPDRSARIELAYDEGRTTVRGPGPRHSVHTFDALGRPVALTGPLGDETRQDWDDGGRPVSYTDPLGAALTRTYDEQGRPTGLVLPTSGRSHIGYGDPAHPALP
ncbi:DUF6531 domain-containing protein, partial [Streptomyces sp. CO7]